MKLYSDFLQSDIVVASPIALATKLSDEVEEGGPADFLSSIEIAIVDRADVQLMQNWAHVVTGAESMLLLRNHDAWLLMMMMSSATMKPVSRHML